MSQYVSATAPVRNTAGRLSNTFTGNQMQALAATRLMRAFSISPEVAELLAKLAGLGEQEGRH